MRKVSPLLVFPALAVVALDQMTKFIVVGAIQLHENLPVIKGFFNLVLVHNRGIAFGLMNRLGSGTGFLFLTLCAIGALLLMLFWFTRLRHEERKIIFGLSLIIGGALGNLIDRLRLQEVIDFLDFHVGPYHWPAFNVADSAITIGALWLAVCLIFERPSMPHRGKSW